MCERSYIFIKPLDKTEFCMRILVPIRTCMYIYMYEYVSEAQEEFSSNDSVTVYYVLIRNLYSLWAPPSRRERCTVQWCEAAFDWVVDEIIYHDVSIPRFQQMPALCRRLQVAGLKNLSSHPCHHMSAAIAQGFVRAVVDFCLVADSLSRWFRFIKRLLCLRAAISQLSGEREACFLLRLLNT